MTDTAKYADIVLPATSSFENTDLFASYWHQYIQAGAGHPSLGESKSNVELFSMLGRAMGFTDPAFHETEEEMMARALDFPDNPYLNGVTLDKLKEHRYVKLDMTPLETYLDRLPTPSGRIELYSAQLEEAGLPPLPTYVPLKEGYDGVRRGRGTNTRLCSFRRRTTTS